MNAGAAMMLLHRGGSRVAVILSDD